MSSTIQSFPVERYNGTNRVYITADHRSAMLSVDASGLTFNLHLDVADLEQLQTTIASVLRQVRQADEAERFDPETAEKEAA